MPGYVIHIAIAKEYLRKHNQKYNVEFILGSVSPDFTNNKSETHYGKSPAYTNLARYLKNNKLDTEFNKGCFLHLVTDYLFYNKYLDKIEKPQIYYDYDYTNEDIVNKYNLELPEEVSNKLFFKKWTPKILTLELEYKIIEEVSNLDIWEIAKNVNNVEWNTYKKLI